MTSARLRGSVEVMRCHARCYAAAAALALIGRGDCPAGPLGPGLIVEVVDETAGSRPSVFNVVAREGAYVDTAQGQGDFDETGRALLAWGRAGTYTVQVDALGYALWTRTGVRVRDDGCLAQTTPVRASLARSLSNNTLHPSGAPHVPVPSPAPPR